MMRSTLAGMMATTLVAAAAGQGLAQEQRRSLSRLEAALCATADHEGWSVRPFVCSPECACLAGQPDLAAVDTCVEPVPGEISASKTVTAPPRDAECVGICVDAGLNPTGACKTAADCQAGSACIFKDGTGTVRARCVDGAIPSCTSDAHCAPGYVCPSGRCELPSIAICDVAVPATTPVVCDSIPETTTPQEVVRLVGVVPPDSPDAVTCETPPLAATSLNSNDALECIALIEAQANGGAGIACP